MTTPAEEHQSVKIIFEWNKSIYYVNAPHMMQYQKIQYNMKLAQVGTNNITQQKCLRKTDIK